MKMQQLGRTGIEVSHLCLGTMTYGQQNTEAEGHEQMDYALERGISFFDAAELYPIPPKRETQGRTEEVIGSWMKARGNRDKVVIATKVVGRSQQMDWFRKDGALAEVSPAQIREAIEGSLRRLQTDYIDLYQIHWPDRPMNLFGGLGFWPGEHAGHDIEEQLQTLDELVREGKVRHIGLSNETPWGTMRFIKASEMLGLPRVASVQNAYNLLGRVYETGMSEVTHFEDVSLLAYSPLAQGYLSGKYRGGALPAGSRKQLFDRLQRYETPGGIVAMEKYLALADKYGLDPAQMAIRFVCDQGFVTSCIIGATSMQQLKTDIDAYDIELPAELKKEIEDVHLLHANPCP